MADNRTAIMKCPATVDNLSGLLHFLDEFIAPLAFRRERASEIRLATEEALANVVNHAYPHGQGGVSLTLAEDGTSLIATIVDQGIPFDILSMERPDLEADIEDRKIGGLGVFLIRELMDEVSWHRDGGSNVLELVAYVPGPRNRTSPKPSPPGGREA